MFIDGGHRAGWNGHVCRIRDGTYGHEGYSCQQRHLGHSCALHIHSNGAALFEQGNLFSRGAQDSRALDEGPRMEVDMSAQPGTEAFMPGDIHGKAGLIR